MSLVTPYPTETPSTGLVARLAAVPAWAWCGAAVFVWSTLTGNRFLGDPDTYWHIAVGQEILRTATVPTVDIFSFTRAGAPWASSSWLAQVLFASGQAAAGWAGPVLVSAAAVAAAFAMFVRFLERRFETAHAVLLGMAAMALSAHHLLARPHVLALPAMVAWTVALTKAAERAAAPSPVTLLGMVLWANLHGGYLFGFILLGAFAIDAVWRATPGRRMSVASHWAAFGVGALAASCITPYGWGSLLASVRILDLGAALPLIPEWRSADFSTPSLFEACLLVPLGAALLRGIALPWPRVALLLGITHMALAHNRNFEIYALLVPIVLASPLADRLALPVPKRRRVSVAAGSVVLAVALATCGVIAARFDYRFTPQWTPVAAVEVLRLRGATGVFNDPSFGGYMITRGMPTFIDGRAELYGARFIVDTLDALALRNLDGLYALLDAHRIDATLLQPTSPAVQAMDRMGDWRRVYTDDIAVVHMRVAR